MTTLRSDPIRFKPIENFLESTEKFKQKQTVSFFASGSWVVQVR